MKSQRIDARNAFVRDIRNNKNIVSLRPGERPLSFPSGVSRCKRNFVGGGCGGGGKERRKDISDRKEEGGGGWC